MENIIKVAVDAMGGDYAPTEAVKGVVAALQERENVQIFLVGKREILEKELESCTYPEERLEIVPAGEVIETGEPPVAAIRKEGFFSCGRYENGPKRRGRRLCFCRQFRGYISRGNYHCRQN